MTNEMTAEEAIEILKYERDNDIFVATEYREKLHEALTKAIKALEQQPSEDCISRQAVIDFIIDNYGVGFNSLTNGIRDYLPSVTPRRDLAETSQDCISRQAALDCFEQTNTRQGAKYAIETLPSVKPKYTDEEIDKAQAVEQAYVDKMVELTVEELRREWLNSFDTLSATKCFEAVNLLKQRLEGEE